MGMVEQPRNLRVLGLIRPHCYLRGGGLLHLGLGRALRLPLGRRLGGFFRRLLHLSCDEIGCGFGLAGGRLGVRASLLQLLRGGEEFGMQKSDLSLPIPSMSGEPREWGGETSIVLLSALAMVLWCTAGFTTVGEARGTRTASICSAVGGMWARNHCRER
jgi:hypothetical protein